MVCVTILFIAAKLGILGRQKIPRIINLSDGVFNGDNVHLFDVRGAFYLNC
jgi:hypothetical protein